MGEPALQRLPVLLGRTMALAGIVLVALNLRTAVTGISPIVGPISADIPLDTLGFGILSMVPPVAFAAAGIFAASGARRLGLELFTLIALMSMVAGHLVRGAASGFAELLVGTILALAGAGVGNVILPPLVKRYFPDRIGLLTSLYATIVTLSTVLPPLVAVRVAESAGWRVSLALWAVVGVVATIPWIVVVARLRRTDAQGRTPKLGAGRRLYGVWRSRTAWAIAIVFSTSSINVYTLFAWLPQLLVETTSATEAEAAALLSLYAAMGIPSAMLVPLIAERLRNVSSLVFLGIVASITGCFGLLFVPTVLTPLWVALAGSCPVLFATALVLINLRTRDEAASASLSGFVQGVGYTIGAVGALAFSLLYDATGGWTVPLLLVVGCLIACVVPGRALRSNSMVEDDLEAAEAVSARR